MSRTYFVALALWLIACHGESSATLLVNGGFEIPELGTGQYLTIAPGNEPVGFGWVVTQGTVDLGNLPNPFIHFSNYEGRNGLDLNGLQRGSIAQNFVTEPGKSYRLSFIYADNAAEPGISTARIDVTDVTSTTVLLHDAVAHSTSTNGPPPNADARLYLGGFAALGTLTQLRLTSTSASDSPSGGILLDAIEVVLGSQCDLNFDGAVDAADAGLMFADWGGPNSTSLADKTRDGYVDAADAGLMFADWTGDASIAPVPEPTIGPLALGLVAVFHRRAWLHFGQRPISS